MMNNQTMDQLNRMKLLGMLGALKAQLDSPQQYRGLSFEERFALIADQEWVTRENRRMQTRQREAKLRQDASVESIDFRADRTLDRAQVMALVNCQWIREHRNVIIDAKTGLGKTFIACALGHQALRDGFTCRYYRTPRLLEELKIVHADGTYPRLLNRIARTNLIILDDWGISPLSDTERRDILEILEDRYELGSTIISTQLPQEAWHDCIGEPTIADSILDRVVHNAYAIHIEGESIRKTKYAAKPSAQKAGAKSAPGGACASPRTSTEKQT